MDNPKILFEVEGDKISTLFINETELRFSSKQLLNQEAFINDWGKSLSFATQHKINFEKIKSISKEEKEQKIRIKYKWHLNLPSEIEFSFIDKADYDIFFQLLEKVYYFQKGASILSPLKANIRYLLSLAFVIFGTVVFYFWALDIANGKTSLSNSGKTKLFEILIKYIGDKGVLIIGIALSLFIISKIWKRIKNPQNLIRFTPPNSF
jgi:hypothetical protein